MAEETQKINIDKLPNSISGDGKNFVMQLKKSLKDIEVAVNEVNDKVDDVEQGQPTEAQQVTNLQLSEENTSDNNGMPQNNILVTFDTSSVKDFKSANIWLSSNAGAKYQQAGTTNDNSFVIKDVDVGSTYYVKVTAVNKTLGESNFDEAPQASITIQGNPIIPDAPTQFFLTWDEEGPLWKWLYNANNYIDFFELRLDANAGSYDDNLLDRTRNSFSRANPKVRSGTGYLFVRNIFGDYSQPATHVFNKLIAGKPNPPTIINLLHGVDIKMDPLPEGYQGYEIVINGNDVYTTRNNVFTYYQVSGTLTVKYCFYDEIGKGEYSDTVTVEIKTVIDDIEVPTIDYDKFDDAIKETIDKANMQDDINKALEDKIDGNTSLINQTQESITLIVADVSELENKVSVNTSAIEQNSNKISSMVIDIEAVENVASANSSKIEQTANSITSVVNDLSGSYEDSQFEAIKGIGSAISQTADSITAVVTELNKPPEECSYSAITVLQDGIDLSVKQDEVISRINLSTEGITIDGRVLHITGDTVIDGRVIIGSNIKEGSIDSTTIADGAITSGKIGAGAVGQVAIADGAVIADKIAANAITSAKIAANAITADKIEAGAITSEKIEADAITAEKIAAEAITSEAIQAGSIIGQHISAGAVTADKLYAGDISMSGELAMVGGSVRLDENGLKCSMNYGEYVTFNQFGMTFFDANGNAFSQISKMLIGQAKHGQRVNFIVPWTVTPNVMVSPTDIQVMDTSYPATNLSLVCKAINITSTGFDVVCYTVLGAGSGGDFPINNSNTINARVGSFSSDIDEPYTYVLEQVPSSATYVQVNFYITAYISHWGFRPGGAGEAMKYEAGNMNVLIELLVNDVVVKSDNRKFYSYSDEARTYNYYLSFETQLNAGDKVSVRSSFAGVSKTYGASITMLVQSFKANTSADVIVKTGAANFIVTENNTGYTITDNS